MLGTRPDLAFSINKLAQYCSKPSARHWHGVKRILRYVKGTINARLILGKPFASYSSHPSDTQALNLVTGYFDAAFMDNTTD